MDLNDRTCLDCHRCRIQKVILGSGKNETKKYRLRCDAGCWVGYTGHHRELYLTAQEEPPADKPEPRNSSRWWWFINPRKEFKLAQRCIFYDEDNQK